MRTKTKVFLFILAILCVFLFGLLAGFSLKESGVIATIIAGFLAGVPKRRTSADTIGTADVGVNAASVENGSAVGSMDSVVRESEDLVDESKRLIEEARRSK